MTVSHPAWGLMPALPGFRMFTSLWGSLVVVDVARAAPPVAILLVGVVVALSSIGQRLGVALLAGVIGWLVVTGFVVNDLGVLALTGWSDAGRLALLVAMGALGSLGSRRRLGIPSRRTESPVRRHASPAGMTVGAVSVRDRGEA